MQPVFDRMTVNEVRRLTQNVQPALRQEDSGSCFHSILTILHRMCSRASCSRSLSVSKAPPFSPELSHP